MKFDMLLMGLIIGLRVLRNIETGFVRSSAGSDLKLRALKRVSLKGPKSLDVSSFGGAIRAKAHGHVKIAGQKLILSAGDIVLKNVRSLPQNNTEKTKKFGQVYALCACKSGKVFVTHGHCKADYQVC